MKNKDKYKKEYMRIWRKNNKEKIKSYCRKYYKINGMSVKLEIIEMLGGKCVRCGYKDYRALQIDHIKSGGSKERKSYNNPILYYKMILESIKNNERKFQLLCANCNWIKKHDNKETRKS